MIPVVVAHSRQRHGLISISRKMQFLSIFDAHLAKTRLYQMRDTSKMIFHIKTGFLKKCFFFPKSVDA
jgi:hypothetical protein